MAEHLIGAHNGTIHSLGKGAKTDSEELYGLIASKGIDEVVQNNVGNGAYALTWLNIKDVTLNVLRNDQRTLFWCKTIGNVIFWASEAEFLAIALKRNNLSIKGDIEPFKTDTLYTLGVNSTEWQTREVKKKTFFTIPSARGSTVGGTSRYKPDDKVVPFGTNTGANKYPYVDQRIIGQVPKPKPRGSFLMPDGSIVSREDWMAWMQCGCYWCKGNNQDLNEDVFVEVKDVNDAVPDFICKSCFDDVGSYMDMKDFCVCGSIEEHLITEDGYPLSKPYALN